MTNKEQIKCKYKFQDKEKFDGKTYCTCFCELCEDSPLCDDNCQIYEDFKQLTSKTLEYEKYKKLAADFKDVNKQLGYKYLTIKKECEQIKEKYEALKLENQEGYEIVAELKHEYEGLKKQLGTSEEWRIKAEGLNEKLELKNTCYRKALEEINGLIQSTLDDFEEDSIDQQLEFSKQIGMNILDIINKAKEKDVKEII